MARTERVGPADEKVTLNLSPVDLGKVDVLVAEGHYANRADFMRTAVRMLLDDRDDAVREAIVRRELTIGYLSHGRKDLERLLERGERLSVRVVGVFRLADDVSPDLADEAIERVRILGSLRAPAAVIERLRPKIERGEAT